MNKQNITKTDDGHRTTGILNFYQELGEHVIPIQKGQPPYMKVDNGYFGYQGTLLLDKTLDRIQCHVCGRWFKCLNSHLKIHDIDHITYKDRFGLYRSEPLARLSTRLKWSEMNNERENLKSITTMQEIKADDFNEKRKKESDASRLKSQWKNKYGTCEAQLRFRLEQEIEKLGRVPISDEVRTLENLFRRRFGTWVKGLEFYGYKPSMREVSVSK